MANCWKCATDAALNRIQGSFGVSDHPEQQTITVSFNADRILTSQINGKQVRTVLNQPLDIFVTDFIFWINQGIRGASFVYPDQEQNFLSAHPEIKPFRYGI